MSEAGRLVAVHDTQLWIVERGDPEAFPLLVLHDGPGMDHTSFGSSLDPLAEAYRLVLVDLRAHGRSDRWAPAETWTLETMASDVSALAAALGDDHYVVLGHSFGALVALQHATDAPGGAAATVVSSVVPSARFLAALDDSLDRFEPDALREQVAAAWAREAEASTEAEVAELFVDQLPFHFADPHNPMIDRYADQLRRGRYSPEVLRHFATQGYGVLDLERRLPRVPQPMLVLAGRHDRTCPVKAAEATAELVPHAELVILEESGHLGFVEEPARFLGVVREFLDRVTAGLHR